jgi:HK97 family phage prohead protease
MEIQGESMKEKIAFDKVYECMDEACRFLIDSAISTVETDKKDMPLTRKTLTLKDLQMEEENESIVKGYISTRDVDHSLDLVVPEGIIIDVFKKNPVILWNHNNSNAPIGKCVNLVVDDYGVLATIEFADTDEAQDIKKLVRGGFLSAFSIGFIPLVSVTKKDRSFQTENLALKSKYPEYQGDAERIIKSWIILEASIVVLPDNPNAIITQKQIQDMEIKSSTLELLHLKCQDCEQKQIEFKEAIEEAKSIEVEFKEEEKINREIKILRTSEEAKKMKEIEVKRIELNNKKIALLKQIEERKNIMEAELTGKGVLVRG